jgi:hypothetical protein
MQPRLSWEVFFLFFFFIFVVLGFELPILARQAFYHLTHFANPFLYRVVLRQGLKLFSQADFELGFF